MIGKEFDAKLNAARANMEKGLASGFPPPDGRWWKIEMTSQPTLDGGYEVMFTAMLIRSLS